MAQGASSTWRGWLLRAKQAQRLLMMELLVSKRLVAKEFACSSAYVTNLQRRQIRGNSQTREESPFPGRGHKLACPAFHVHPFQGDCLQFSCLCCCSGKFPHVRSHVFWQSVRPPAITWIFCIISNNLAILWMLIEDLQLQVRHRCLWERIAIVNLCTFWV